KVCGCITACHPVPRNTGQHNNYTGGYRFKMKRITSYFLAEALVTKEAKTSSEEIKTSTTASETFVDECSDNDWPSCWTVEQKTDFCSKNEWLWFKEKKLGCTVCRNVGSLGVEAKMGMKISTQWSNGEITCYGEDRKKQLTSLRKKIFDHKESAGHQAALKIKKEAEKETLDNAVLKCLKRDKLITAKVFRTAYKVAKANQSFNNFEMEVDLQELNGVDMGCILHSTNACINIVNHISIEMRKNMVKEIVCSESKISLMIDESTTLSQKSTLIVYIRSCVQEGMGMTEPVNLFLDLVELESVTAKGVFDALLGCLKFHGITEEYLKDYLVSLTCDGASVMLGCKRGVKRLLIDKFPSVIVWHCANHRLELSVADTVKVISGINRFKSFLDKLYVLYHASPKNSRELHSCAEILEVELLKIGRVLSTRWVSSSFRSVFAVWNIYEALVKHFEECTYEGLKKKITSTEFILDLGLMCDALQELSELSLDLQERNMDLYKANQKITALVQVFEERRQNAGTYYKRATTAAENLSFHGVVLHKKNSPNDPPIDPNAFYKTLKESIEKRLLANEDAELAQWAHILDQKQWPENVTNHQITFGEMEIRKLSNRLQLNEREMIRGFREYLMEKTYPETLLPLIRAIHTIPISSSECERGFSQMNLIITSTRASLMTKTVSSLLFIRLVGPPLTFFDPSKYVDSWLLRGRHSAVDSQSRKRKRDDLSDENMRRLWKLL
uniref:HAT C-terminal dimerisation domain-containing protein n=1 Tax=Pelusios castaneus TaxID=367368 RepID=A0A8C8RJZ3_9SAUR